MNRISAMSLWQVGVGTLVTLLSPIWLIEKLKFGVNSIKKIQSSNWIIASAHASNNSLLILIYDSRSIVNHNNSRTTIETEKCSRAKSSFEMKKNVVPSTGHFFDNAFAPSRTSRQRRTAPIKKKRVFPLCLFLSIPFLPLSQAEPVGGGGGMSRTVEGVARRGGWQASRIRQGGGRLCERARTGGWDKRGYRSYRRFYVTNQS